MGRFLPVLLRRPSNLISVPAVEGLPVARRAGFLQGDPEPWIPATLARLTPLPWSDNCDFLLAPAPRPGVETASLLEILRDLPPALPVCLYERDWPLWPNLLLHDGSADSSHDFATPSAGLRAYRSAFRHGGRGQAEALCLLPASRLDHLLRLDRRAARGLGASSPLLNRRHLETALDFQRSLDVCAEAPGTRALAPARRIAVIAPHFDDDVIQAGGAILQGLASGAEVRVIWMTDGARGLPAVGPAESTRIRKEEARAAMNLLGVQDYHFLDAPEERVSARGPWIGALRRLLEEFSPERTHVVWWADNHVDHYETSRALRAAWPQSLAGTRIAAAGTWAPLPGCAVLPLTPDLRRRKDAAISAYRSQLDLVDYLRAERGLTRWQARDLHGVDHAECFWELPAASYFAAFRQSGADRRVWI